MISIRARQRMVQEQLENQGINDLRVLTVMKTTLRHLFVEEALASRAYNDETLPIGEKQTLSQPYTVARMSQALKLTGSEEILEIGTGSGYQTAISAQLAHKVFTMERLPKLTNMARKPLRRMEIHNIVCRVGDGTMGWPHAKLFNRIIITAGTPTTPTNLIRQLAPGGILIAPEGSQTAQTLIRITHNGSGSFSKESLEPCCFVPLIGTQGWQEDAP